MDTSKTRCPCILWLEAYGRLGNYEFYQGDEEEWKKHTICMACKLAKVGHGGHCELCHGKDVEVKDSVGAK